MGSLVRFGSGGTLVSLEAGASGLVPLPDDSGITLGDDKDNVLYHRSSTLGANTALSNVLEGTPVTPALAANSLIISNITNDGDILLAASDAGNSKAGIHIDGSTPAVNIYNLVAATDMDIGANLLKTTNLALKEGSSTRLYLRDASDTTYTSLDLNFLFAHNNIRLLTNGTEISAPNADGNYVMLKARDDGTGRVEVARLQGAADPYFQATLPMVLNPSSAPGTPVEGHFYYDSTANKLKFYNGTGWETVTSS